jgi:hypothetical protein
MFGEAGRDGASSEELPLDIDERDFVVVPDEFVQANDNCGGVDWAPGFRSPVSSRPAKKARCKVSAGVGSSFCEAAPNRGVVRVWVAELVECFTNNGGLVGGETA